MLFLKKSRIILSVSKSKKHTYGVCLINGKKYFFKENAIYEEEKYNILRENNYVVPKLLFKEDNISYYEYDEDLYSNTLYDLLYFKDLSLNEVEIYFNTLEKRIFACKKISKIDDTNSYNFFNKRINHLDKIGDLSSNIIKYFQRNCYLRSYISNGDLTDTNICLNGKVCDAENAGNNLVSADLGIFFVSILYGSWIYPKYHKEAYDFRVNKIKEVSSSLNIKQMFILNKIISLVKKLDLIDQEYFKVFLLFRLLSPITFDRLDFLDKIKVQTLFKKILDSKELEELPNICQITLQ